MTGVSELREVAVVSPAPESIRVSVLGVRTQLDVALPADVPVAAFLPELARLVESRTPRHDEGVVDRDERRTFWVLGRVDGDAELSPETTLRAAGVGNGELLRVTQRRALSPPTLYDDVVDAAARLNRASYAAWDAAAAGVMAIVGVWLCSAIWVYFLVTEALSANRGAVVTGAALTVVAMVGGAALAHRALGRTDVAGAAGVPTLALSAALGWALTRHLGDIGLASACVVLLVLTAVYFRVIGTGHWAYLAGAVVFAFGAIALGGIALGARTDVVAVAAGTVATLGCLAVPALTARSRRSPLPTTESGGAGNERQLGNPFALTDDMSSGAAMPTAEEVWARVHSAALTRAGLVAGLAVAVVAAAAALLDAMSSWPALVFALICAAVLALSGRRAHGTAERAALAVPGTALALMACIQAQGGAQSVRLGGVIVLVVTAVVAVVGGLLISTGRVSRWVSTGVAYLEYIAVAALLPLALWPLGIYDRLGL